MTEPTWQPSATPDTLRRRARLLADIRAFFAGRDVLEADVPALSAAAAQEPQLDSLACGDVGWLHTSPEFGLKRLLAAGIGPVYQLSHVFRAGETGRWHNPEFSMLEWYRPGWGYPAVLAETEALLVELGAPPLARVGFDEVFTRLTGLDWRRAGADELQQRAARAGLVPESEPAGLDDARRFEFWLDALVGLELGPDLGQSAPCAVCEWPPSLAGLTRIRPGAQPVAERFEIYWQGVELANGGTELTDAATLRERFDRDAATRRALGKPCPPVDRALPAAMDAGLPDCAGVALGVDRLLALLLGFDSLAPALSFAADRA